LNRADARDARHHVVDVATEAARAIRQEDKRALCDSPATDHVGHVRPRRRRLGPMLRLDQSLAVFLGKLDEMLAPTAAPSPRRTTASARS
jgi:hypothetical protein